MNAVFIALETTFIFIYPEEPGIWYWVIDMCFLAIYVPAPMSGWQVSGPQPICGRLVGHFSEWDKTDTFSLCKECPRHFFHSI